RAGHTPANPSIYLDERTFRTASPTVPSSPVTQHSASSSASDSDAEDDAPGPLIRSLRKRTAPAMTTVYPVPFSLGKPPSLSDLSPQSLTNFLLAFELYFDLKDVTSTRKKILMVGLSITSFVELNAWWTGAMAEHLVKTYDQFVKDLKREWLPRDYVWEMEKEI
ncbi:hypothetical protein JCM11641_002879, partial [Rhodosporidiobolus odoratus]